MKKAKLKKKFIWKKIENGYLYGPEESQPKQEDWEKEFDRKFPYAWIEWEKRDVLGKITEEHSDKIKEIKSFIRNLIAKEREKGYGDCLDYYGLGRNNR